MLLKTALICLAAGALAGATAALLLAVREALITSACERFEGVTA